MSVERECIYCGNTKEAAEFSQEHIWPDALGGDYLPGFWQTNDVCQSCNNMSGVFVDGGFIKSFAITGERANDALSYLSPDQPTGVLPLIYLGVVQNVRPAEGEVIDYWVCAPGANVLHIRMEEKEDTWNAYAGGDPRRGSKKSKAGRVILSLTSPEPYWVCTSLRSVLQHFPKAKRFVTNLELPANASKFQELDPFDAQQADDLRIVRELEGLRERGENVHIQVAIDLHADGRFLAKVALAVGYRLFGHDFISTDYAKELRKGFREADPEKRFQLNIHGSGYLRGINLGPVNDQLRWPGGWQLALHLLSDKLALVATAPTGRVMCVQVTDDISLLDRLGSEYRDGVCWVTVPPAQTAAGPLPYPEYIAHMIGAKRAPSLTALEALRGDPSMLPKSGLEEAE
ncbi:HNH endonuclease [Roseibacterium beibuensis]|uniref:HNH endonuclease 5 domain-containing protein n=1 Tax=[Roseibacterium] beibuensis TaxID=1193142 RepID=A0ABP9L3X7_9RHOB|nr:HNH endonuclease [Roseibacterium beibuensis]MCS6623741.1 HNH endonuclease [Roseibacterium beibuensis]